MNNYIGHPLQISGVEEMTLATGKGKGMTVLQVRNGKGLELTLLPDRCLDMARVGFKGDNMGWFAPCGYVAPAYYDKEGAGFLKSFQAGFMTTCGLAAAGAACVDGGEALPLHGSIGNTPCERYWYTEDGESICIHGIVRDAALFGHSYLLERTYTVSKTENRFRFADKVTNIGNTKAPCMLLYHINLGYPLLSEHAELFIPANGCVARDGHADKFFDTRLQTEKPQAGYRECCYYYDVKATDGTARVGIFNPDIKKGLNITFDKDTLPYFTQWKMMGENEYVLGMEPGNVTPDGRDVMRRKGILKELDKGEAYGTRVGFAFAEEKERIEC